mgnify:FL=1|jgi:hypothetical protein
MGVVSKAVMFPCVLFWDLGFGLGVEVLLILTVGWGSIVMLAGIVTLPSR